MLNKMKLTEEKLRQVIRETIEEFGYGTLSDPDVGKSYRKYKKYDKGGGAGSKSFGPGYSSKEAKTIMNKSMIEYAKILRKAQYKIIKDWMSKAKAGAVDYFDIVKGVKTGDVKRAYPYEIYFLADILNKEKIIDRFRSYFGGKKGMRSRRK